MPSKGRPSCSRIMLSLLPPFDTFIPFTHAVCRRNGKLRVLDPVQRYALGHVDGTISLQHLLGEYSCKLSKDDVYALAVALTASFLQLWRTPWLRNIWSKNDIVFLRSGADSSFPVDAKYPFIFQTHSLPGREASGKFCVNFPTSIGDVVAHIFCSQNKVSARILMSRLGAPQHDCKEATPANDSSRLLAFGVILLEINYGRTIESLRHPEDLGPNKQPNELTDLKTAKRCLTQRKGDISWALSSAISHCLKCFVDPTSNPEDSDFCRTVQEHVVVLLQDEMHFVLEGPLS